VRKNANTINKLFIVLAVIAFMACTAISCNTEKIENRETLGGKTVEEFMKARMKGDLPLAEKFLTSKAKKEYQKPGYSLVGTSNPHFFKYEILENDYDQAKGIITCKVRIYEAMGIKDEPYGFFDETLVMDVETGKIDSVLRSGYNQL